MAASSTSQTFDGIVDNKASQLPKPALLLFVGLILWGVCFCGYYLLSGWSSSAEFEVKMKPAPATAPR